MQQIGPLFSVLPNMYIFLDQIWRHWHLPWWLVCNKLKRLERPLMRPPDALVLLSCRQLTPIVDIDKGQKDRPPWHFGAKKAPPIWASWLLDYFVGAEEIWIQETSHDRHYNFPAKEETKKKSEQRKFTFIWYLVFLWMSGWLRPCFSSWAHASSREERR